MMPKSQAKIKPPFSFSFLTLKKHHVNKYTILSLNSIMRLYSNVYDYAIYTLNYYEDKYFISLFSHFMHKAKLYNHCAYTQIIIKKSIIM